MRGDRFTFNLANSSFNALKQAKSDQTFQVQISWRCNEDQTQHTHTSTDMQYTYFPNANYEHTPIPPICKSYYLNVRKLSEPIGAQNTRWAYTLCFVMVFAVYGTFLVIPTTQSHTRFHRLQHAKHHLLIRSGDHSHTPMEEPPGAVQWFKYVAQWHFLHEGWRGQESQHLSD